MYSKFTVADLRAELDGMEDTDEISFSGGLTFSRFKRWGDDEFVMIFNEAEGYLGQSFKKRNPHVLVAFINNDYMDTSEASDDGAILGSINVSVT